MLVNSKKKTKKLFNQTFSTFNLDVEMLIDMQLIQSFSAHWVVLGLKKRRKDFWIYSR